MSASRIAIVCPECATRDVVPPARLARELADHNNLHHDGEPVATVATGGGIVGEVADD